MSRFCPAVDLLRTSLHPLLPTLLSLLLSAPAASQELPRDWCTVLEDAPLEKGLGEATPGSLWPDGVVPYRLQLSESRGQGELLETMKRAIATLNETTNVCLVPYSGDRAFVNIIASDRAVNYAQVGHGHGARELGMYSPVEYIGVHELLHSLGILHEQSRPDRDEYVQINWANIRRGFEHNFRKVDTLDRPYTYIGPYDFNSLMHYGTNAFSYNGAPTINRRDGRYGRIGHMYGLTDLDVAQVNAMYPEPVRDCAARIEARTVRYIVEQPDPGAQGFCTGQELTFRVTTSHPNRTTYYKWQATGGEPNSGKGANFTTHFAEPGTHLVHARMTTDGINELQTFRITVTEFERTVLPLGNPVPVGQELQFRVNTSRPNYQYALYDALGRTVTVPIKVDNPACGTRHGLAAPTARGTYYLRVAGDGISATTPIVVH